jgi:hypothetical protein
VPSPAQAVRTLTRAQELVRAVNQNMTGDVRVELANGTYQLAAPLALTSGVLVKDNHKITGPSQIPTSIVDNTGLEPAYRILLTWTPR